MMRDLEQKESPLQEIVGIESILHGFLWQRGVRKILRSSILVPWNIVATCTVYSLPTLAVLTTPTGRGGSRASRVDPGPLWGARERFCFPCRPSTLRGFVFSQKTAGSTGFRNRAPVAAARGATPRAAARIDMIRHCPRCDRVFGHPFGARRRPAARI